MMNKNDLKNNLLAIFQNNKNTAAQAAEQMANAVDAYIRTATVTTTVTGAVVGGAVTGTGTGTLS